MTSKSLLSALAALALSVSALAQNGFMKSIQDYGVLPSNSAEVNKKNLQKAINEASASGAALYVTPVKNGYKVAAGIVLKKNVSLVGAHGPVGRGTCNEAGNGPTGSVFIITDDSAPFITVESATSIRGIQFYYPDQSNDNPSAIVAYPPTIKMADEQNVEGVTLSSLTFNGEWEAMNFRAKAPFRCEQILFEHCYGYPLSGKFISVDRCYDIPRILHCHVNPANMRHFGRSFSRSVIDSVVSRSNYTYWIDHTDNAQLIDIFTFGNFGGAYLGPATYGQLTNFNFDCVMIGIYKTGDRTFNRDWEIAQGSIIANAGTNPAIVHPFVISGLGHTSITNVIGFSGNNGALTNCAKSYDFVLVEGDKPLTLSITGCRMANYVSSSPFTVRNPAANICILSCVNAQGQFIQYIPGDSDPAESSDAK